MTVPAPMPDGGFAAPPDSAFGQKRRKVALAELIATAALALSTLAVATVLSIGLARADAPGTGPQSGAPAAQTGQLRR